MPGSAAVSARPAGYACSSWRPGGVVMRRLDDRAESLFLIAVAGLVFDHEAVFTPTFASFVHHLEKHGGPRIMCCSCDLEIVDDPLCRSLPTATWPSCSSASTASTCPCSSTCSAAHNRMFAALARAIWTSWVKRTPAPDLMLPGMFASAWAVRHALRSESGQRHLRAMPGGGRDGAVAAARRSTCLPGDGGRYDLAGGHGIRRKAKRNRCMYRLQLRRSRTLGTGLETTGWCEHHRPPKRTVKSPVTRRDGALAGDLVMTDVRCCAGVSTRPRPPGWLRGHDEMGDG